MSESEPPDCRILDRLYTVIEGRRGADPKQSYIAKLFERGTEKIAQKVGEEAVELVVAATVRARAEVVAESADLLVHMLTLWADAGVRPGEVYAELARREGVSGHEQKRKRRI